MPISLPNNVLELKNEEFFKVVQQQCGKTMVEVLRYLEITSADYLLDISTEDLFAFFHQESPDLIVIKGKVGVMLNNGNFVVKNGLLFQADNLIKALRALKQQNNSPESVDLTISSVLLNQHPILRQIINLFQNSLFSTFMYKVLETMISNYCRSKTRYSYSEPIREFASCIYIFGGRNVYEFIRINIQGFLPSLPVIHREIDSTAQRIEGEFRYNLMADYLASQQTNFVFAAEDCTAVVPRIVFDPKTNTFVGFTSSLENGIPKINSFSTESFSELENWFDTSTKSHLLNLQIIQPIKSINIPGPPFILSCYGTDNQFKTDDILMKWMNMINRCCEQKVKLVGFSTDCDPRYLRSMRLFSGFFAEIRNHHVHMRNDAFHVDVPTVIFLRFYHSSLLSYFLYLSQSWTWFFMRNRQLTLFFQDSIHLCTKLRNRLLSSKATMLLGDEFITIDHLFQLIESSSKINHGLVKSDVLPKDRQNFSSCEKISSNCVLDALLSIPNSQGTRIYLEVCLILNHRIKTCICILQSTS